MEEAREPLRGGFTGRANWVGSFSSAVTSASWRLCVTLGTIFVSVGMLWRRFQRRVQPASATNLLVPPLSLEVELHPRHWVPVEADLTKVISEARAAGRSTVNHYARGWTYRIDLKHMMQVNTQTGKKRRIRLVQTDLPDADTNVHADVDQSELVEDVEGSVADTLIDTTTWHGRKLHLKAFLTSPQAQLRAPTEVAEEPGRLSDEEVKKVFIDNVPGVTEFLYREKRGNYALGFMVAAYRYGLRAYSSSEMGSHFTWLMRLIVHYGYDKKPGAASHLREVAEAFMDCQAVQARAIEKVGLEIRGFGHDFRGQILQLVEDYKTMSVKMLALEEVIECGGPDGFFDPPHFESRVIVDIGDLVGLGETEIRRASLDEHAEHRFAPFSAQKKQTAAKRFREIFDMDALLKGFVAEVNTFSTAASQESLSRQFLKWVDSGLAVDKKHLVFDEETCTRVEVDEVLALAIMEVIFFGKVSCDDAGSYRGHPVAAFFP